MARLVFIRERWPVPFAMTLMLFSPPQHWYWSALASGLLCVYAGCIARRVHQLVKEATRG